MFTPYAVELTSEGHYMGHMLETTASHRIVTSTSAAQVMDRMDGPLLARCTCCRHLSARSRLSLSPRSPPRNGGLCGPMLRVCLMSFAFTCSRLTDAGCPKGEEKPNPSLPCLYVGSSGKTADEALLDHETGRYPRRGTRGNTVELRRDLMGGERSSFPTVMLPRHPSES